MANSALRLDEHLQTVEQDRLEVDDLIAVQEEKLLFSCVLTAAATGIPAAD